MSKLRKFNKTFTHQWDELKKLETGDNVNDTEVNLSRQQLIDDAMRTMIASLSVEDFMLVGHAHDDFIIADSFRCASDEDASGNKSQTFGRWESFKKKNKNLKRLHDFVVRK